MSTLRGTRNVPTFGFQPLARPNPSDFNSSWEATDTKSNSFESRPSVVSLKCHVTVDEKEIVPPQETYSLFVAWILTEVAYFGIGLSVD